MDHLGLGEGADLLADQVHQGRFQRREGFRSFVRVDHEGHVGVDRLALYIVVEAHHGCLRDGRVEYECTLHLCGANAMAGDVDHVIHAPRNPVISILVPASAVAGEIDPGVSAVVRIDHPLVIAIDGTNLAGPTAFDDQVPSSGAFVGQALPLGVHERGAHPEKGSGCRTRL